MKIAEEKDLMDKQQNKKQVYVGSAGWGVHTDQWELYSARGTE